VASLLLPVEFKKLIKLKLGFVPALLSLLSENACTVILCLAIYLAEQLEINHVEFKQILDYICLPERKTPLQPRMLFDFLQNEIGIDVRVRFKKMASVLSDRLIADADNILDDDSSEYSPNDGENYSTSDEDYEEEPPSKILRSHPSHPGSKIRLAIKLEDPRCATLPNKERSPRNDSGVLFGECGWENCLVCERESPIMLQTQNPTWAAIMRVVFYSFIHIFPNCEYWMVRQAYKFIEDHWEKLCPGKNKTGVWRKQLQDALSHNKQYFISGMDKFGQKGYWGLKQIVDPWAITDQDDHPKRAYHHQPRRGRPPKSGKSQVSRKDSKSYYYKCCNLKAIKEACNTDYPNTEILKITFNWKADLELRLISSGSRD